MKLSQALALSALFGCHQISQVCETSSTSDDLKQAWALPEISPQIRIADCQTAGRGQHGRRWQSRPGQSLLFSFSLTDVQNRFPLSMIAGLALYKTVRRLALHDNSGLWLKWPNDLWLNRGKLAGILCEGCFIKARQHWVIGIGINLAPLPGPDFPAASLSELSACHDPEDILCEFFANFEELLSAEAEGLAREWSLAASVFWQTRFLFLGSDQPDFVGLPLETDADGTLLVKPEHEKSRRLLSATLKPLF
jgi:BirA family biotin operon repressor/biotin-[acetyl-CoA-carboxylase] ligase